MNKFVKIGDGKNRDKNKDDKERKGKNRDIYIYKSITRTNQDRSRNLLATFAIGDTFNLRRPIKQYPSPRRTWQHSLSLI
jgi:hypothetical protein